MGAPPPQNDQQQPQGSHGQAHPELGEDDEEAAAEAIQKFLSENV